MDTKKQNKNHIREPSMHLKVQLYFECSHLQVLADKISRCLGEAMCQTMKNETKVNLTFFSAVGYNSIINITTRTANSVSSFTSVTDHDFIMIFIFKVQSICP